MRRRREWVSAPSFTTFILWFPILLPYSLLTSCDVDVIKTECYQNDWCAMMAKLCIVIVTHKPVLYRLPSLRGWWWYVP